MGNPAEFSFRTRTENLRTLSRDTFDVLVIGGGITGAGVARDAALRGLRVALIERKDFAAGTSSRSSKLVHGGLRYLQQADVGLVREAATERYVLRRLAPHLARPRQILVPVASWRGYAKIKVGLMTYDRLASVPAAEQHRMLGKDEALQVEPSLRPDAVYGAGLYYEYLTDDSRLVVETTKAAAGLGATIVNHAEVIGFHFEGERVAGAHVRDSIGGDEFRVRAHTVINCGGPWVDAVRLLCERGEKPRLRLTKGIHLGLPRNRYDLAHIVIMTARDRRSVFAIPQGEVTYVGTTDTFYDSLDDYPTITMEDVTYLLDALGRTFLGGAPDSSEVVSAWAGLRPLLHEEGKAPSEISRKDEIMQSPTGLLSIAGGKLTTFRRMAERIVDLACEQLRAAGRALPDPIGASAESMLSGGDTGDDIDAYAARLKALRPEADGEVVDRLVRLYGSNAGRVLDAMRETPGLAARCVRRLPLTRAEVDYVVRHEMAMTLEDVLERRTRLLLWDPENGLDAAEPVARQMAQLLGWPAGRIDDEVSRYRSLAAGVKTFAPEAPAAAAAGA